MITYTCMECGYFGAEDETKTEPFDCPGCGKKIALFPNRPKKHEKNWKDKLKPCPFCGNTELNGPHCTEYIGDSYAPYWWIECVKCPVLFEMSAASVEVGIDERDEIIRLWNTRINEREDNE